MKDILITSMIHSGSTTHQIMEQMQNRPGDLIVVTTTPENNYTTPPIVVIDQTPPPSNFSKKPRPRNPNFRITKNWLYKSKK
jgi:hypothetical protein